MTIESEGEIFYTASEAARYLHISRDTFYENVKAHLQPYKPGALKRVYYRQSELDEFRVVQAVEQHETSEQQQ